MQISPESIRTRKAREREKPVPVPWEVHFADKVPYARRLLTVETAPVQKPFYLTSEFWTFVVVATMATVAFLYDKISVEIWLTVAGGTGGAYVLSRGVSKVALKSIIVLFLLAAFIFAVVGCCGQINADLIELRQVHQEYRTYVVPKPELAPEKKEQVDRIGVKIDEIIKKLLELTG